MIELPGGWEDTTPQCILQTPLIILKNDLRLKEQHTFSVVKLLGAKTKDSSDVSLTCSETYIVGQIGVSINSHWISKLQYR